MNTTTKFKNWRLLVSAGVACFVSVYSFAQTPITTTPSQHVTRVITDFNGYFSSQDIQNPVRPNHRHHLVGFEFNDVIYSTGVNDGLLSENGIAFTPQAFRALPFQSLGGTVPAGAHFIVAGGFLDGSTTTANAQAPHIAHLTSKSVLTDGIRGLDISTGVTNLSNAVPLYIPLTAQSETAIGNETPVFVISQIAQPATTGLDRFTLVDADGNAVGNPLLLNFGTAPALAEYDHNFFSLEAGASYDTATPIGPANSGPAFREIRLIALRWIDFGITMDNADQVVGLRINKGSNADPAFYAYNENAISLGPVPQIAVQPQSISSCTTGEDSVTFSVTALGDDLTYEWRFNNQIIEGATASTYTIDGVTEAHAGIYTVWVRNEHGEIQSENAYLNHLFASTLVNATTCQAVPSTYEVYPVGAQLQFQWYENAANSYEGAVPLEGQTTAVLQLDNATPQTKFYFVEVSSGGLACNATRSTIFRVIVNATPVAGTATISSESTCSGEAVTLQVTGHSGSIRWQYALASNPEVWVNATEPGNASATFTPTVTTSRIYRAALSRAACATVYTNELTLAVYTENTWLGAEDTNWQNAANWSCQSVPNLTQNVHIPVVESGLYPVASTAMANNLTVDEGTTLTVNSTLQLAGTLAAAGQLNSTTSTLQLHGTNQTITGLQQIGRIVKQTAGEAAFTSPVYVHFGVAINQGTIASNGHITFESSPMGTAIAQVTGTGVISGAVVTERYLGARAANRLVSSSVTSTSLYENWQENGELTAGFGTLIGGSMGEAAGFDFVQTTSGVQRFNQINQGFEEVENTQDESLLAGNSYQLFVQGDRQTTEGDAATATRLRTQGELYQASSFVVPTANVQAGDWVLVGNPYQNQMDLQAVLNASTGMNPNYVWVWDPYLNARGGYAIVDVHTYQTSIYNTNASTILYANQAVFMQADSDQPVLAIQREQTVNGIEEPQIMSLASAIRLELRTTAQNAALDGALLVLQAGENDDIDNKDATKLTNPDESLALVDTAQSFGILVRDTPELTTRIPIELTNLRHSEYELQLTLNGYTGPTMYLHDLLDNSYTPIDQQLEYAFSVNPEFPEPRFALVFEEILSNPTFGIEQVSVYPNPVTAQKFVIRASQAIEPKIHLFNLLGQAMEIETVQLSAEEWQITPKQNWAAGTYLVQFTVGDQLYTQLLLVQ